MLRFLSLLLGALFGATACTHLGKPSTAGPAPVESEFDLQRDVVFTPPDWPQELQADVYVPRGAGPFPAVVVMHPGAWSHGSRSRVAPIAERLARRGFVAVNIAYRFAPEFEFPAQLQDAQQAVIWMRANAVRNHIDPERIGAFGYSAGAHLATLLGGVSPGDALFVPGAQVRAVVGGGTPADLVNWSAGNMVPKLIGGKLADKEPEYRAASPIDYVSPGDPPVFLFHGSTDRVVPINYAEDYKKRLDEAGVPNELFILNGRGHITGLLMDGPAVEAALAFLDRYLRS